MNPMTELLPVVTPDGTVTGSAPRSECHSGSMILHPVVHLHVIDRHGRLLLQRRSLSKKIQPGKWDTAVGGHVDYGETIGEALMRETREETGLDATHAVFLDSYVFTSAIERELVNVYWLQVDDDAVPRPEPGEIDEFRFMDPQSIARAIDSGEVTPNFASEYSQRISPLIGHITDHKS